MTAAVTAMITAVVGVLGTLFAPVIGRRLSARQRDEETRADERRRRFEERRDAYTAMNRASREGGRAEAVRDARTDAGGPRRTGLTRRPAHSDGVEALVPERVASAPQLASSRRASADGVSGSAW
ncbi:hypothetical protein GCM10010234_27510 [Streptomyces hawaiiensis]